MVDIVTTEPTTPTRSPSAENAHKAAVVAVENGVKVTRYPFVPVADSERTFGPDQQEGRISGNQQQPHQTSAMTDRFAALGGEVTAAENITFGSASRASRFLNVAATKIRAVGQAGAAAFSLTDGVHAYTELTVGKENEGLKIPVMARVEYAAIASFTKIRENLTATQNPEPLQDMLVKWGVKNKIKPEDLARLQITTQKLSLEEIKNAMEAQKSGDRGNSNNGALLAGSNAPLADTSDRTQALANKERSQITQYQMASADASQPVAPKLSLSSNTKDSVSLA